MAARTGTVLYCVARSPADSPSYPQMTLWPASRACHDVPRKQAIFVLG